MSPPLETALRRVLEQGAEPADLVELVSAALDRDGLDRATIQRMVDQARQLTIDECLPVEGRRGEDGVMYFDADNLPPGTALLQDAADQAEVKFDTLTTWVRRHKVEVVGKVPGKSGAFGGKRVVRLTDVLRCKAQSNRGGRPKKLT